MPTTNTKYIGIDVKTFSLSGNAYIGDVSECSIDFSVATAEGAGIDDVANWPVITEYSWAGNGTIFVNSSNLDLLTVAKNGGLVAFAFNSGTDAYTGTCMISSATLNYSKTDLMSYAVSLKGYGAIVRANGS